MRIVFFLVYFFHLISKQMPHCAAIGFPSVHNYIIVFSYLTALLSFYVEFGWLAARKAGIEKNTMLQTAEENNNQWESERYYPLFCIQLGTN